MPNIVYNKDGEVKIIEKGSVQDELSLQWKKNTIDQSVLNNLNRQPRIMVGERIGITEEGDTTEDISRYNAEIEINGSNFITDEDQRILLVPNVTEIDSGNSVENDNYVTNWYLNGELLDGSGIFELNTENLINGETNIIKLEVILGENILTDRTPIIKYLGFESSPSLDGDGGSGSGGSDGDGDSQTADGGVLNKSDGIIVTPNGNGYRVGEKIRFEVQNDRYDFAWNFGDGRIKMGRKVNHSYDEKGVYNVDLLYIDMFDRDRRSVGNVKIKIVE